MKKLEQIKELLKNSRSEEALAALSLLERQGGLSPIVLGRIHYLRGNAYRQQGDWRMAINSYLAAIELDPDGPAAEAYRAAQQVLAFYDHDLYNP